MKQLKFLFKWVCVLRSCEKRLKMNFIILTTLLIIKLKCQD